MRRLVIVSFAVQLGVGCAPPASFRAQPATPALARSCGDSLPTTRHAWTVEGFGGQGDTQLMMTRQQTRRPCVPRGGAAAPKATLGARQ